MLTPLPLFSFCLPGSSKVGEVVMRQGVGQGEGGESKREGEGLSLAISQDCVPDLTQHPVRWAQIVNSLQIGVFLGIWSLAQRLGK